MNVFSDISQDDSLQAVHQNDNVDPFFQKQFPRFRRKFNIVDLCVSVTVHGYS